MPTNKGQQLNLTYPPELIEAARATCQARGTTITAELRKVLERLAGVKTQTRPRGRPKKTQENS